MWKCFPFLFAALFAAQIEIASVFLDVEIADNPEARRIGLSGRTDLLEDSGMLFIFERAQMLSFWMKDTLIPLSIGFFDANRVLLQIEDMNPLPQETGKLPVYKSKRPSLYALEVPQGWFEQHHIKPGSKFKFVKNAFPDQANPIK
jgi:uncharacterized membrane protein (UPF0127 family)